MCSILAESPAGIWEGRSKDRPRAGRGLKIMLSFYDLTIVAGTELCLLATPCLFPLPHTPYPHYPPPRLLPPHHSALPFSQDYERPLPEGWKDPRLGFVDPIFEGVKYDQSAVGQLEPKPPPQPAPYRGR